MNAPVPATPLPAVTPEEKLWVLAAHLAPFVGFPIIIPLIVYLAKRDSSVFIGENAREALNFHITLLALDILFIIATCFVIGIPFLLLALLAGFIFPIVAAIQASEGRIYRYPLTLRLI